MIKMAIFDIDGTLVEFNQHKLSLEIKQMFKRLKQKNIIVVLATGRDFVSIGNIHKTPNVDYFIGANGAFIYDLKNQKYIFSSSINFDDYEKYHNDVLLTNENSITNVILSDDKWVYVWEKIFLNDPWFWTNFKNKFQNFELAKKNIDRSNFHLITVNCDSNSNLMEISKNYFTNNNSSLEIQAYWSNGFFVSNKDINKAFAIKKLALQLSINIKDIIAFGDGENDIQMIKEVGIGVAMQNAIPYLKEIADDVTSSVSDFGTIHYLEKRGII